VITFEELWEDVSTYQLDSCLKYHELEKGIKYANGCGAKGGVKFPDHIWFISIISACIIHDIEWTIANCYRDLLDANERFDDNLKKIVDYESFNDFTRWVRRYRVASYINGVELKGTHDEAVERGFIGD